MKLILPSSQKENTYHSGKLPLNLFSTSFIYFRNLFTQKHHRMAEDAPFHSVQHIVRRCLNQAAAQTATLTIRVPQQLR